MLDISPLDTRVGVKGFEMAERYAIAFDLKIEMLRQTYGESYNNAYMDIKKFLETKGFDNQQGSLYYGKEGVNAVSAVMAVSAMAKKFSWLAPSVRDIRLLRIENDDDLMPALDV